MTASTVPVRTRYVLLMRRTESCFVAILSIGRVSRLGFDDVYLANKDKSVGRRVFCAVVVSEFLLVGGEVSGFLLLRLLV